MKFGITLILLFSIILMTSVLAFSSFNSVMHMGSHFCLVSGMLGTDCPSTHNNFAMAVHHLSGFQNFTQSIVSSSNVGLSALVLLFSLLLILSVFKKTILQKSTLYLKKYEIIQESVFNFLIRISHWISIIHKRNPYRIFVSA